MRKIFQDVIFFNCRALVASVPFFTNAESAFVSDVVCKLAYEVFQPGMMSQEDSVPISPVKIYNNSSHCKV